MRFVLVASLVLVACSSSIPLSNRPCPCSVGWSCCPNANICVENGTSCPSPAPLAVTPTSASLPLGGTLQLSSNVAATWAIEEANAPITVDADGRVSASVQGGTFHVVATAEDAPGQTATVTLTVGPTELGLVLGTAGGFGDADGVGTAARFGGAGYPAGLAGDGNGNLYVSDTLNNAIRKVVIASGEVSTIASNVPAPASLDFEAPSTLYVLTQSTPPGGGNGTRQLARVDITSGALQPIASPWPRTAGGVWFAADGQGHLYLTDSDLRGYLRRVDAATGAITNVAGMGAVQPSPSPAVESSWDGTGSGATLGQLGPITRVSGSSDFLFVDNHFIGSDANPLNQWTVRDFNAASSAVTTQFAFPASDQFFPNPPYKAICAIPVLGGQPYFYLAYGGGENGQVLDADGRPSAYGNLVFTQGEDGILPDADVGSPLALYCSQGIEQYYYLDSTSRSMRVRSVAGAGPPAPLTTLAGGVYPNQATPVGPMAFDPSGNLWLESSTATNPSFDRIDPTTGGVTEFPGYTEAFAIAADGNGFFVDNSDHAIFEAPLASQALTLSVPIPGGDFITAIVLDDDGHAYVQSGDTVYTVTLATKQVSALGTFPMTSALAFAGDSLLLVHPTTVERLSLSDGSTQEVVPPSAGFLGLTQAAVDLEHNLAYLADPATHRVAALDLGTGQIATVAGQTGRAGFLSGPLPAGLNAPTWLALGPDHTLYVADKAESLLVRIR